MVLTMPSQAAAKARDAVETEIDEDEINDIDDEEPLERMPTMPPLPEDDLEEESMSAHFTLHHPFQNAASGTSAGVVLALVSSAAVVGVVWMLRRLTRKKGRDVADAFLWQAEAEAPEVAEVDLSRPLLGHSVVVAENVPVAGTVPSLGGRALGEACGHDASFLRRLTDGGALLAGAARADPLAWTSTSLCTSLTGIDNPAFCGRAVLGSHGAVAALVAAGKASLGIAMDGTCDLLLPAACCGLSAFRCSRGLTPLDLEYRQALQPEQRCASPAMCSKDTALLAKAGRLLGLPGSTDTDEDLRLLLTADLFILIDSAGGEKVTNGIVTRAVTSWLSERENARQVQLLEWLAKELEGWDSFADKPRGDGAATAEEVLAAIACAHGTLRGYELGEHMRGRGLGPVDLPEALRATGQEALRVEAEDYKRALELRESLDRCMRKALGPSSMMLMPILAGAPPRSPPRGEELDKAHGRFARLTLHLCAFVAMMGCPSTVLPVPPLGRKGAPWAVLLLGRHRCDLQLLHLAARLSGHITKTAQAIEKEQKEEASKGPKENAVARQRATEADRAAEGDVLKQQGNQHFGSGRFADAISAYTAALRLVPKHHVLLSNRAAAYIKLQQWEAAWHDCNESLKANFTVKAAFRRCQAATMLDMLDEALMDCDEVLRREPGNSQARDQAERIRAMISARVQDEDSKDAAVDDEAML